MIGVNVFGLIRNMQDDLPGTFQALAKAGFDEVEMLLYPRKTQRKIPIAITAEESVPVLIAEAETCGLQVHSAHVFDCFVISRKELADYLEKLHRLYGIRTFVFSGMFRDAKGARRWANFLKALGDLVVSEDIRILYHNHSQEFEKIQIQGQEMTALDYFFCLAGEKVGLQLDIGWAGIGGDELEIARKYANRIVSIHLKDFTPGTRGNFSNENMPRERFCAIGNGEIRTAELLAIRDTFPNFNGSVIIDQDQSTTDILEDAVAGFRNISTMR